MSSAFRLFSIGVWLLGSVVVNTVANAQFGGVDVNVDPGPAIHNEISLTLVPGTVSGQPQVLLAAYNDTPYPGGNGLGVSYSTNGGSSWTSTQLPFPISSITGAMLVDAFDPTVAVDTQGRLFAAHISTDGFIGPVSGVGGLYVRVSTDLGQTWSTEVEVAADPGSAGAPDPTFRFNDRCQMTADRFSASSYTDRVYIAWIKDRGWYDRNDPLNPPPTPSGAPPSDIYFSYSTTAGASFSTPAMINDSGHDLGNMPVPRVAADGTVLVSWLDYDVWNGGQGTIYVDKSTDGGVTWGTDQMIATINLPPLNVTTGGGVLDALAKGAPVLATSPTNSSALYMVYAADPDGVGADEADIFFIRSTNQGVTWSVPLRLNTDATKNDQILPWIDVKANGTIDVAWYDRRNDVAPLPLGDQNWDIYITHSIDGGNSFLSELRLNDQSFPTPLGGAWMGEYLGLVVDSDHAYVAWSTSHLEGNGDVYFDKLANPPLSSTTSTTTTTITATTTTTTTTTTLPVLCAATPASGCRLVTVPLKGQLLIQDKTPDKKDRLKWKWSKGAATTLDLFLDPISGSADYGLCLYEDISGTPTLLKEWRVFPGGMCDGKPCWKVTGSNGFKLKDKTAADKGGSPDGIDQVKMKAGDAGKAQVQWKGKGGDLLPSAPPYTVPVLVQFLADDGVTTNCWETTYTTSIKNVAGQFKAKGP